MSRICLYYRTAPEKDRWLPGDRLIRPAIRRLLRGTPRIGGVDRVFLNLCLGLDRLGIPYLVNLPYKQLGSGDRVGVLGRGRLALAGYERSDPIVAGIGLMTHPSEWPSLCEDYPVVRYLQHSEWANNVYKPYFGNRCTIWPVGIDTEAWKPQRGIDSAFDLLVYDKLRWNRADLVPNFLEPVLAALDRRHLRFKLISYGHYTEEQYRALLARCKGMIFLCEHESQGLAYQECLASGVPVLAWDQGWCLDQNRFAWGMPEIPASSVPYFNSECGETFLGLADFEGKLDAFCEGISKGRYKPRGYILENLTLESCASRFVEILDSVRVSPALTA